MSAVRVALANILMACAVTIMVVVLALIVPLVLWLLPDELTEKHNG